MIGGPQGIAGSQSPQATFPVGAHPIHYKLEDSSGPPSATASGTAGGERRALSSRVGYVVSSGCFDSDLQGTSSAFAGISGIKMMCFRVIT